MDTKIDPPGIYDLSTLSIEEIQAYLKTKGLGTFNLSLPFHYIPKNEDWNWSNPQGRWSDRR